GKIYRSTNAGESWEPVFQASTDVDVYSFNVLQNGDALVGTIGNGMYRSTDNGATWQSISTGLSSSVFFSLSVNQSGHIFAGTLNDGLIRSTNGGTTWTSLLNSGLPLENPFPYVRSMVFNNDSVAFAGTYGRGVYQSTNNGNSWTPRIVGLPIASHFVLSLAINSQGDVFAGTESGIYRWVNNSGNWSDANSGLGNVYVRSVIVTPGGHVLAGTAGSGIFRTVNPTTSVESVAATTPTRFSLEQNYPNPFNPRTNVGFRVAERGFVTLKVFDLLGKEIATLVSEELSAGTYSIPWDASSLPSGVYLYRLQTGAYTETKKALLVK
ncbi:MAG TPA: T9SS type A sorting domain-containing protein, partial [Bacteroidota bacterium]